MPESMDTSIEVRFFITDTPSRAFLVSTRYPTHSNGCHRFEQRKVKGNFSAVPGELRTDDSFNARAHPTHHSAVHESQKSVLEQHNFKMISQFPIDAAWIMFTSLKRQFLLYTGIVFFKHYMSQTAYWHFLCLSLGYRII